MEFTDLIDLAAERLGGSVVHANDEFFAPRERLLKAERPEWREHEYTDRGKWMDGWETRRRREPGHDWAIIRLGLPGLVRGINVDTSHFTGNYPPECSIDACTLYGYPAVETLLDPAVAWTTLLPRSALRGDGGNLFPVDGRERCTHLRFNIFPDGGVARLRVYGVPVADWARLERSGGDLDLAAAENGGLVIACSDMWYGPRHNLIMPGPPLGMKDGWETRRRRGPGHDWVVVQLARPGRIERVDVDTTHFKGNAPGRCSIEVCDAEGARLDEVLDPDRRWAPLLPDTPLHANTRQQFHDEVLRTGRATHARFNIFPDGGVGRLRLWGR